MLVTSSLRQNNWLRIHYLFRRTKNVLFENISKRSYVGFQCSIDDKKQIHHEFLNALPSSGDIDGYDTVVKVDYSTMNYKDALAVMGIRSVMRTNPLIPGIDLAGTVLETSSQDIQVGDKVILTGWGSGETHNGGLQTIARVKSDHLIPLPSSMDTYTAMSVGTAGYTAMLCKMALEERKEEKIKSNAEKQVVVTGSCGGVGSIAILLMSRAGYHVSAITGRPESEKEFLYNLGAKQILDRSIPYSSDPTKPLSKEKWDAAIDTTGSTVLANLLTEMKYGGSIAACGLAAGMDLTTTVAPFILRNVSLLGIDSVKSSRSKRIDAWSRLATELQDVDMDQLGIVTKIHLNDVVDTAKTILAGKIRGRTVVDLKNID